MTECDALVIGLTTKSVIVLSIGTPVVSSLEVDWGGTARPPFVIERVQ